MIWLKRSKVWSSPFFCCQIHSIVIHSSICLFERRWAMRPLHQVYGIVINCLENFRKRISDSRSWMIAFYEILRFIRSGKIRFDCKFVELKLSFSIPVMSGRLILNRHTISLEILVAIIRCLYALWRLNGIQLVI